MADNQVELVKQKTDIVTLIDGRVKLTKSGRNFRALCPFHGEKSPSFFVSAEMQTYKCFGCGRGGDALTFIQEYEGLNFPEALEFLAEKAGVVLKRGYGNKEDEQRKRHLEILHMAEEYYHFLLTGHEVGRVALNYLKGRGIPIQLVKVFNLGYAPESWDNLQKYLVNKKKYRPEELEAVGLVIRNQGVRYYDRFRGRVMFPLKDMRGKTLGFSGRVLESDTKEAKYINSPETSLYHKSKMLYGLDVARSSIKLSDRVVVVEGELDVISSYKAGVKETVAIKGSALTQEQVELINRLTKNVILSLDADNAGAEATKRGIEITDKAELNVSVVEITGGKDPDDLAQKDPEGWRQKLKKSVSVYDYLIDTAFVINDAGSGQGKRKITKELAKMLSKINNLVEQDHYLGKVAERLKVSKDILVKEVDKVGLLGEAANGDQAEAEPDKSEDRSDRLERFLTGLYLQMRLGRKKVLEIVDTAILSNPGLKKLWQELLKNKSGKESDDLKALLSKLPKEQERLIAGLFSQDVVTFEGDEEEMVKAFRKGWIQLTNLHFRDRLKVLGDNISQLENKDKVSKKEEKSLLAWQSEYQEILVSIGSQDIGQLET